MRQEPAGRHFFSTLVAAMVLLGTIAAVPPRVYGQQNSDKQFYDASLHSSSRGFMHVYAKENGGLERITGIPFTQLHCNGCHVRSCDTCHAEGDSKKMKYSVAVARSEAACNKCHNMKSRKVALENPSSPNSDVHFAQGFKCMQCHTVREVHGDGVEYASPRAPGAMDARCENCHELCASGKIHGGKVDCNACHARDVNSCYNCHFDTRIKEKKSVSLPLKDTLFLINSNGKVTTAALHTFIYQNRTLITFAPAFSHSVTRKARQCGECHGAAIPVQMQAGTLKLITWDGKELKTPGGVVPVVAGYNWNFPFLNYENGHWVAASNAVAPFVNYSRFSSPMSAEQLEKMAEKQTATMPAKVN
jgi:hypothetical protein